MTKELEATCPNCLSDYGSGTSGAEEGKQSFCPALPCRELHPRPVLSPWKAVESTKITNLLEEAREEFPADEVEHCRNGKCFKTLHHILRPEDFESLIKKAYVQALDDAEAVVKRDVDTLWGKMQDDFKAGKEVDERKDTQYWVAKHIYQRIGHLRQSITSEPSPEK